MKSFSDAAGVLSPHQRQGFAVSLTMLRVGAAPSTHLVLLRVKRVVLAHLGAAEEESDSGDL